MGLDWLIGSVVNGYRVGLSFMHRVDLVDGLFLVHLLCWCSVTCDVVWYLRFLFFVWVLLFVVYVWCFRINIVGFLILVKIGYNFWLYHCFVVSYLW